MKMLPVILTALLIVIVDPYEGIKYDEVSVYDYVADCGEECIGYTESEGWEEDEGYENIEMIPREQEPTDVQIVQIARQIILLNQQGMR
jgi:hypothetical protein